MRGSAPQLEQLDDSFALPRLCGEMERGDAVAVVGTAEGAALVRVGAELDERADGLHPPFTAAHVSGVPRYGSASTCAPSSTRRRIASRGRTCAAQTSASSSTS